MADGDDLETALLELPTPWLRSVKRRCDIRGHRARARVAATIADRVHRPPTLGILLDRHLGTEHPRMLGRIVAAARLPLEAPTPARRQGFVVPRAFWQTAKGIGGQLRQLGLVFLGVVAGRVSAYVPRGARPVMADVLADRLRQLGPPGDDEPFRLWLDPASGGLSGGVRDEWATSIRDALSAYGTVLRYSGPGPSPRFTVRVVRVHAPELVESEPHVVWGEGVCTAPPFHIAPALFDTSLAAANLLLERLS